MRNTALLFLLIILCVANSSAQFRHTGQSFATRSETIAKNGMVATSQPLATEVGLEVLKKGGTAIDAAIAANAVLGLVEPTGNGIGGDIFALIWDAKTKKLYALNGSGRSPQALTMEYFKSKSMEGIPGSGALSVSVPGCVDGWFELHKKFGKLPMKDLLTPAVQYARQGFPVSEVIAAEWLGFKPFPAGHELLRIQFDDQLFVDVLRDIGTRGQADQLTRHFRAIPFQPVVFFRSTDRKAVGD